MLGFPVSTEFNKRIPKQKFYDNLDVSPTLRRVFVDQIRLVYWRNKLAASTLNIAAGEVVSEVEVFEVRLNEPKLDEAVLKQIDKEIPYHILFILTCDGKAQAWIGYKEAAASGSSAFKVNRYYHTDWMPEDELQLRIDGLNIRASRFCRCSSSTRLQSTSSTTRLDIRSTASMRICSRKNTTTFSTPCSGKSETKTTYGIWTQFPPMTPMPVTSPLTKRAR